MLYCYDERLPLESFKREIQLAVEKNIAVFYNEETGFVDSLGKRIDIKGKRIMPRTFVSTINQINEVILSNGGLLVLSHEDDEKILNWPKYYRPKRKAFIFKGKDLTNEEIVNNIRKIFGDRIFIKTKEKNFNGIIPTSLLEDKECNFYKALLCSLDTDFIVSGVVDLVKDEYGIKEYRCIVMDNEVANISRFTENVLHTIRSIR